MPAPYLYAMDPARRLTKPQLVPPDLPVAGPLAFRLGRTHEVCGPARAALAVRVAARLSGPVVWIRPAWQAERLNPDGLRPTLDPARLIFVDARRGDDILWCLEEALRAGAVPLAVAEVPEPPALTPVRRLHLACETGGETAGRPPLALLLTPGRGGAAGVESRWFMAPAHAPGRTAWRLERLRARTAPPAAWTLDARGHTAPLPDPAP